jgi:hypothetical protein
MTPSTSLGNHGRRIHDHDVVVETYLLEDLGQDFSFEEMGGRVDAPPRRNYLQILDRGVLDDIERIHLSLEAFEQTRFLRHAEHVMEPWAPEIGVHDERFLSLEARDREGEMRGDRALPFAAVGARHEKAPQIRLAVQMPDIRIEPPHLGRHGALLVENAVDGFLFVLAHF